MIGPDKTKIQYPLSVLYIESFQNYLEIHYTDRSKIVIRATMKAVLSNLPEKNFMRIHNRLIVNLLRVKKYKGNSRGLTLELTDCNRILPVSRTRVSEFLNKINLCEDEIVMTRNDPGYTFLN